MVKNKRLSKKVNNKRKSSRNLKYDSLRNLISLSDTESDQSMSQNDTDALRFTGISPQVAANVSHIPSSATKATGEIHENQESKNTRTKCCKSVTRKLCLNTCLYDGQQNGLEMLRCCICMTWVHPQCCGDLQEDTESLGAYTCSQCRQIYSRLAKLESQVEKLHDLNKTLVHLLENSQQECASLRLLIQDLIKDKAALKHEMPPNREQLVPSSPLSSGQKPVPKPRQKQSMTNPDHLSQSKKPKFTLLGDSMIRGLGQIIPSELKNQDVCILSKSGLTTDSATNQVIPIAKEHSEKDIIAIHLGTNDVNTELSSTEIVTKFKCLMETLKRHAPNTPLFISALSNRVYAGSARDNHNVAAVNKTLREICHEDQQCTFIDCNPPILDRNYKRDGLHFSWDGINIFGRNMVRNVLDFISSKVTLNQ